MKWGYGRAVFYSSARFPVHHGENGKEGQSTLKDECPSGHSVGAGGRFPDGAMLSLTGVLNTDSVYLLPLHLFILGK